MDDNILLLDQYCDITREIEQLRNKVLIIKLFAEEKIKKTTSNKEKEKIFKKFKKDINAIQNDKIIKNKYKELKSSQKRIYNELLNILKKSDKNKKKDSFYYIKDSQGKTDDINVSNTSDNNILQLELSQTDNSNDKEGKIKFMINKYKNINIKNNQSSIDNKNKEKTIKQFSNMYNLIQNLKFEIEN